MNDRGWPQYQTARNRQVWSKNAIRDTTSFIESWIGCVTVIILTVVVGSWFF